MEKEQDEIGKLIKKMAPLMITMIEAGETLGDDWKIKSAEAALSLFMIKLHRIAEQDTANRN